MTTAATKPLVDDDPSIAAPTGVASVPAATPAFPPRDAGPRPARDRRWLLLAVVATAQLMIVLAGLLPLSA